MVERVVLHIGMHKTGSSSIQASLQGYDDGSTFYATFAHANHSIPIVTAFSADPAGYHIWTRRGLSVEEVEQRRRRFRSKLSTDLARTDRQTLVLSGEDIGVLHDDEKRQLLAGLGHPGRRVLVVVYVREPTSFTSALYAQAVRGGVTEPAGNLGIRPHYLRRIGLFAELVGAENTVVRAYDRPLMPNGSVVQDFCDIAELDTSRFHEQTRNETMTAPALKLVLAFNRSNPCNTGDRIVLRARWQLIDRLSSLYADGAPVDPAHFAGVADHSEVDDLRAAFGVHLGPSDGGASTRTPQDLDGWLLDTSDVDLSRLDDELVRLGTTGEFPSVAAKLNRLYYALVADEYASTATESAVLTTEGDERQDTPDSRADQVGAHGSGFPGSSSGFEAMTRRSVRAWKGTVRRARRTP